MKRLGISGSPSLTGYCDTYCAPKYSRKSKIGEATSVGRESCEIRPKF